MITMISKKTLAIAVTLVATLQALAVSKPSINFNSTTKVVEIVCSDAQATLYYTVDGSDPTTSSYKYTEPFTADRNMNLRAIAVKGDDYSSIASNNITVESRFLKDGIYYRLRPYTHPSVKEVEVCVRETGSYTGAIVIPSTVTSGNVTYTVTRIGQEAFYNQDNVTSVTIPNTVDVIGYQAFQNMDNLKEIEIPGSVKTIGAQAFYDSYLTKLTLHEGLERIDYLAFYKNNHLTSLTLPSTLTTVEREVFKECTRLKTISLPNALTTMGNDIFNSCTGLTSVQLPATMTSIPVGTFNSCTSLRSIDVPSTVQSIGDYAFNNCDALTSVTLPAGVQTLGPSVFRDCDNLLSVSLPEGITEIPTSAFYNDYTLTTVSLPSTLATIGEYAFYTCRSLTSITIPENVTTIGKYAFTKCDALASVYAMPSTPPTMGSESNGSGTPFYDCLERTTLYVKAADMANYTGSQQWDAFTNKAAINRQFCEQPTFTLKDYVLTMSTTTSGATIYYTTDGSEPTTASTKYTSPIYFMQNGTVKAIAVKDGLDNSTVSEFVKTSYTVATPTTKMDENFVVTIDCESSDLEEFPETTIYYYLTTTTSNGAPSYGNSSWIRYEEPLQLTKPRFVYVYAERDGWTTSSRTYYNYSSNYSQVTPTIDWNGTTGKAYISNYSKLTGSTIHYTIDGTIPTADSPIYSHEDSIPLFRDHDVKAIALRDGYFPSEIGTKSVTGVAQTFYLDGLYYRLRNNTVANEVEVTKPMGSNTYTGDIVVPATIKFLDVTYDVTRIGESAFYDKDDVTSVTLPASVNSIGSNAFYSCGGITTLDLKGVKTIDERGFYSMPNLQNITLHEGITTIGKEAFAEDRQLRQINFPNGLVSIGQDAFRYCNAITEVNLPASIKTLSAGAFNSCSGIKKITLPEGLETIGDGAFQYNSQLTSVTVPSTVKAIEHHTFRGCTRLISVQLPAQLEKLDYEAFYGCTSLLSFIVPDGVTSIGNGAFYGCTALATVSLPQSLTTIGNYTFSNCSKLTTITLPESVSSIGTNVFSGCSALTSIYCLGQTPATTYESSFTNVFASATLYVKPAAESNYRTTAPWNQFTTVQTFDNALAAQPTFTFENYSLTIASTTDGATIYYTTDGSEPTTSSTKYTGPIPFWKNGTVKAIATKEGLDNSAVSEFTKENLTVATPVITMDEDFKVTITCEQPDIEGFPEAEIYYVVNTSSNDLSSTFSGWTLYDGQPIQLTRPRYVHAYAKRDGWIDASQTYQNYSSNYSINTPSIGWNSTRRKAYVSNYNSYFTGCTIHYTLDGSDPTRESAVYNPDDSIAINRNLIVKTLAVQDGHFDSDIATYTVTGVNATFLKDGIYYRLIDNVLTNEVEVTSGTNAYTGDITIPATVKYDGETYNVTRIGESAFSNKDNLTSVTLPNSIKTIGKNAFNDCDGMTAIDIPGSVTTIEDYAFNSMDKLQSVTFHEGLQSIGQYAFKGCGKLQSFTLPEGLQTLGGEAFRDCGSITNVVVPNSVTTMGMSVFHTCTSLESVTLSNSLTEVAGYMFQSDSKLKSIVIPEGVTKIGLCAFLYCSQLTSAILPSTLKTMETNVFSGCKLLPSVSIPEGVTAIPEKGFEYCYAMTTVSLPTTLTSIGQYAFRDCTALTDITLPANLTSIADYAFTGCSALTSVYTLATTPPTLSDNANTHGFASVIGQATLYTKTDAKEAYENKSPWDAFSAISSFDNVLAAQPTFTLGDFKLVMKTATPGATIYYTRDNTDPTTESTKYTAPIPLLQNDTIRAIAVAEGFDKSVVSEFRKNDYRVDVPTVSLSDDLVMTISYTEPTEGVPATKIYYKEATYDQYNRGLWNQVEWKLYEGPVQLTKPRYYKVMAMRDGWIDSYESSIYNFYSDYRLYTPSISSSKDATTGVVTITLKKSTSSDEGDIYYTIDGTDPSAENGTLYTEPFELHRNLTVKAVVAKDVHFDSDIATSNITNVSQTFYINKVWYKFTDNSLTNEVEVTSGTIAYEDEVTIPATVTIDGVEYNVVGIGTSALENQDKVTTVSFPSSLKYIGKRAFYDCDYLTAVDIPASVKTVYDSGFDLCDRLATVTLHEGLDSIGTWSFASLPALKSIVLPSTLLHIGTGALGYNNSLTSVQLPPTLTSIPESMFRDAKSLTSVTLPETVTRIGNLAFTGAGITTLQIPANVTEMGTEVFNGCTKLTNIVIPEGITELKTSSFYGCSALTSVELPSTLQTIANQCFRGCSMLESITLPGNLKSIGAGAFASCSKLLTVYSQAITPATLGGDPSSSYNYSRDPFSDTKLQATLYVNETAVQAYKDATRWQEFSTIIGSDKTPCQQPSFELADYRLTIKSLTDGAKIYYTNDGSDPDANAIPYTAPIAFVKNDTIRAVAMKDGMAQSPIGQFIKNDFKVAVPTATMSDDFVVTITCEEPDADGMPETHIYYKDSWRDGYWSYETWKPYEGPVQLTEPRYMVFYATRDGWNSSNQSSTYNYYSNYRLEKPSISWSSDNHQFTITNSNADAKIYYTIDGTTPSAENGTEYTEPVSLIRNLQVKAVAVQDKYFNSTVDSIKVTGLDFQFMNNGLYYRAVDYTTANEVELLKPSGVTYSGDINVPETVTYDNEEYTVVGIKESTFNASTGLTSIKLPSTLRTIGNLAFYGCTNLEEIEIPGGVQAIPEGMMDGCTGVTKVTLNEGLKTIGPHAFYNNKALVDITLPSTLTSIGTHAFYQCQSIKTMIIPDAVQTIGEQAFRFCYAIEQLKLPAGLTEIAMMAFAETAIMSVDIPATVRSIGQAAFGTCKKLRSIALPEGITSLGDNAFDYCESLTTVELPTTLQSIGSQAFYQDKSLENIILPATLTSIGSQAFVGCSAMERVYSLAQAPPNLNNSRPFDGVTTSATLYVPANPSDVELAYRSAAHWGDFSNIKTFTAIPCAQPTFSFDDYMLAMTSKTEGVDIYFTTDGSEPTTSSIRYTGPIALVKNDTIRAIAAGNGWGESLISEFRKADYKVPTPTSAISTDLTVTINVETPDIASMPKTNIYYNINRSSYEADNEWTLYEGPFKIFTAGYIHMKAERDGWIASDQSHKDYYTNYYLAKPTISPTSTTVANSDTTITISHAQEDVQLYYTLDGTDPNIAGVLYTEPIKLKHNVNVQVVARREGAINSDPEQKEYKWFTVATPKIAIEHLAAVVTVEKPENVTIRYTLNNTEPTIESAVYNGPIPLSEDCYIRAKAFAENWNDSPTGFYNSGRKFQTKDFTVATPVIANVATDGTIAQSADSTLTLTCATDGATIYYTTDGTTPTINSTVYEAGAKLKQNGKVRAIAVKEDMYSSAEGTANVVWFKVSQPHIDFNGKFATLTSDTEGATIYYTTDGTTPTEKSNVFQGAFQMPKEQTKVQAYAVKDNWNDSDPVERTYYLTNRSCEAPVLVRVQGTNTVKMTTRTEGESEIHYTTDGTNPTANDQIYEGEPIEVAYNQTLKAMTTNPVYFDSEVTTFEVNWFKVDQPVIAADKMNVTITCQKEGARIFYTLDGSEPTEESALYQGPIAMNNGCVIKALGTFENYTNSTVAQYTYRTDEHACIAPTFTRDGNTVSIATAEASATIYYTTDGTDPTEQSNVYNSELNVAENMTIKAIAANTELFPSEIVSYDVNWFKVEQPVITSNGIYVDMTCATENAQIYYTLDGSAPTAEEGIRYSHTITMTGTMTIKAIAVKENFTSSTIASTYYDSELHRVSQPLFRREGNKVSITTNTTDEGTTIYYTTDGSTPSIASNVYSEAIEVAANDVLKAIAVNENLFDSEVTTFNVNWFTTDTPVITFDGIYATITCPTENARIYYTLDGTTPTAESLRYTSIMKMAGTCTVKAIAVRDNFNNSAVATEAFDKESNTVGTPLFSREGNNVTISTATAEGTTIYYTTDGTEPTTASLKYTGAVEVTENTAMKAIAVNEKLFDSEVTTYNVNWFTTDMPVITFDGIYATMTCTTEKARIHYTLDGTTPTAESPRYTSTLKMAGTCTVKALAVRDNFNNSAVATEAFDKESNTVGTPLFSHDGNSIAISTATASGTTIYYTTDGTEPTTASLKYTGAVDATENMTMKAIAVNEKLFDSEVATFNVNWFTVEMPVITFDGFLVTMTCPTENTRIYYTLDGQTPTTESLRYSSVLKMAETCTVKAMAVRDNFNNSTIVTEAFDKEANTVGTPTFQINGNMVTISTETTMEGTTIYYTTDGTEPTTESLKYTGAVEATENTTMKAIAVNDKLFPSGTAEYGIDWFKVATPVISLNGKTVTITCETPNATIHYALGEDATMESPVYTGPITVEDNREVRVMAERRNYKNSDMASVMPDLFVCEDVTFKYDGRYLTMKTGEGMTIYYTTDGSRPTTDAETYSDPVDIDQLCIVTAVARRRDFRDSQPTTYKVTYLYDGEEANVDEPGHLEEVFEWSGGTASVETLPVKGHLNAKDLGFIKSISSLKHLDLTDAVFEGDRIPDEAFAGMPLLSFTSPKQVKEVGKNLFKGCDDLAAIVWNANTALPQEAIEDVKNPNLLLYVNSLIYAPTGYSGNVISGGQAVSITLTDTETGGNFYCPQQFYTQQISYTHSYTQKTESGVTRGWETLSLPFDVQTITHEKRGAMAPFAKGEDIMRYKPFWLYELTGTGFERSAEIKAYTPYIVSMPNNPNYADDYILAGKVTFASQNVYVEKDDPNVAMKGSVRFTPSMQRQEASGSVLLINLEDYTDKDGAFYVNGSAFLANMREAHPFEACALVNASSGKEREGASAEDLDGEDIISAFSLDDYMWGDVTDMMLVEMEQLEKIGEKKGVYDMSGRHMGDDSSVLDEDKTLKQRKVYIVNGKKVLVK